MSRNTELPGTPLTSGLRPLTDAEQAEFDRQHRAMIRRLQPKLDDIHRAHIEARAESITAWIG